ncbi:MAG TPA: hypothetical protein VIJ82_07500 [Streptosporangiaceae bacterium]
MAGFIVGGSAMGPASGAAPAFPALAIRARIPVDLLIEVIYPYPTFMRGAARSAG